MRITRRATRLTMFPITTVGLLAISWTSLGLRAAAPQDTRAVAGGERSIWEGVYTEGQSKRGERVYADSCTTCHTAELTGSQVVPPLVGDDFLMKWNGAMVGELFEQIRQTMPQDGPGSLTSAQYADVLAFILSKNRFPAGNTELASEYDALKSIRIEPAKKPGR